MADVTINGKVRIGFGQLEPNHLSAPRNGQVYGQLPAYLGDPESDFEGAIKILEQGQFVRYNYAKQACTFDGDAPWMMVYNEEKLYDERHQMHRDYAQQVADSSDGKIYPRVFAIHAGDIFTTNTLASGEYTVDTDLKIGATGILENGTAAEGEPKFKIVKVYTMPDGQPAVKVQVIKA